MDETPTTPPEPTTPTTEPSASPADNGGDDESPPKSSYAFPCGIAGGGLF